MLRDKIFMSLSTLTRMISGMVVFIILARYLGPAQYGIIATGIAYSMMLSIISDFGMATYTLRLAGAAPERAAEIVNKSLGAKLVLSLAITACAIVPVTLWRIDLQTKIITSVLFLGVLAASFADIAFIVARATSNYGREASAVLVTSLISIVMLGGIAAITHQVFWCAVTYTFTRLMYFLVAMWALRPWLALSRWIPKTFSEIRSEIKQASNYALDSIVTTFSGQIDVIIIGMALSHAQTGIYQAGSRLIQAVVPFAVILSTVYLPKMAHATKAKNKDQFERLSRTLNFEMAAIGAIGFGGFLFLGPIWTKYVYGPQYKDLISLWPGFASFVLLRFVFAAYGIQLAALGEIKIRIMSQTLGIAAVIVSAFIILPLHILQATPWMICIGSIVPLLAYGIRCAKTVGNRISTATVIILSLLAVASTAIYTTFNWVH